MSFVSSKGNILCRLIKIELYKIFAIINRAIKSLHCNYIDGFLWGVITHPYPKFNGGLAKPPLKLGHG